MALLEQSRSPLYGINVGVRCLPVFLPCTHPIIPMSTTRIDTPPDILQIVLNIQGEEVGRLRRQLQAAEVSELLLSQLGICPT